MPKVSAGWSGTPLPHPHPSPSTPVYLHSFYQNPVSSHVYLQGRLRGAGLCQGSEQSHILHWSLATVQVSSLFYYCSGNTKMLNQIHKTPQQYRPIIVSSSTSIFSFPKFHYGAISTFTASLPNILELVIFIPNLLVCMNLRWSEANSKYALKFHSRLWKLWISHFIGCYLQTGVKRRGLSLFPGGQLRFGFVFADCMGLTSNNHCISHSFLHWPPQGWFTQH